MHTLKEKLDFNSLNINILIVQDRMNQINLRTLKPF